MGVSTGDFKGGSAPCQGRRSCSACPFCRPRSSSGTTCRPDWSPLWVRLHGGGEGCWRGGQLHKKQTCRDTNKQGYKDTNKHAETDGQTQTGKDTDRYTNRNNDRQWYSYTHTHRSRLRSRGVPPSSPRDWEPCRQRSSSAPPPPTSPLSAPPPQTRSPDALQSKEPFVHPVVVWWLCDGVVVWWRGGVVAWWCGGVVVWWRGGVM